MERELTTTKTITFSHIRGTIMARVFRLDEGVVILVTRGTRTRVGVFSRAVPGQEAMTIQFPGRRDGVIGGHWAEEISRLLKEPVTVECGIHFDDLSGDEIQMILGLCGEVLESLCRCWNPQYDKIIRQHPISRRNDMKYYMVEGIIQNAGNMNDHIMKQHMAYTQKAMDRGMVLISGLGADMNGGMFIMKAETLEETEHHLANEPFYPNGIQEYKVIEFNPHYPNPSTESWIKSAK